MDFLRGQMGEDLVGYVETVDGQMAKVKDRSVALGGSGARWS